MAASPIRAETLGAEEPLLRAALPDPCIETWCDTFVSVLLIRTAHARCRLRMLLPPAYPDVPLRFELDSETLPPQAIKRLTKQCEKAAAARVGKPQLLAAVSIVQNAVRDNLFLVPLAELRAIQALAEEHKPLPVTAASVATATPPAAPLAAEGASSSSAAAAASAAVAAAGADEAHDDGTATPVVFDAATDDSADTADCTGLTVLSANHTTGVIKLKMSCGRYVASATLTVPPAYPDDPPSLDLGATTSTTMPEGLRRAFAAQAVEIGRKCAVGYTVEEARRAANPITMPAHVLKFEQRYTLDNAKLKTLTSDVRTLKQVSALRGAGKQATGGPQWQKTLHNAGAKAARRELARLSKSEMTKDMEALELEKAEQQAELSALIAKPSGVANGSLLAMVEFLLYDFVWMLPRETCQVCGRRVMPTDPAELAALLADAKYDGGGGKKGRMRAKEAERRKPIRVFCGHWLHWGCLDTALTTPPFGKQCSRGCGRALYHPDWPSEVAKLEKAWTMKEARRREIEEVTQFMGI